MGTFSTVLLQTFDALLQAIQLIPDSDHNTWFLGFKVVVAFKVKTKKTADPTALQGWPLLLYCLPITAQN